jgi:hypothetical protein
MTTYSTHTMALIVKPQAEPIFSEMATIVRIEDEAAGPYVVIEQTHRTEPGKVAIDGSDWPHIRDAVDHMLSIVENIEEETKEANRCTTITEQNSKSVAAATARLRDGSASNYPSKAEAAYQ